MPTNTYPHHHFHHNIKDAEHYWNELKLTTNSVYVQADKWKMLIPLFEKVSAKSSVLVLLWDITATKFLYAVEKRNVTGYDMSLYAADGGLHFSIGNIHPDHYDSGMAMTQKGFEHIVKSKESDRNKIICNYDGLYKKKQW